MKELQERIKKDGIAVNEDILKVDSFINHQVDPRIWIIQSCYRIYIHCLFLSVLSPYSFFVLFYFYYFIFVSYLYINSSMLFSCT